MREKVIESAIAGRRLGERAERVDDFAARAVVERKRQNHAGIGAGRIARLGHFALHDFWQFMLAPDVSQPDVVVVERADFGFQVVAQKPHQEIDFRLRPLLPVLLGERVKRQRGNADPGRSFDGRAHGRDARAVSRNARQMAAARPAAVAVHDDRNVPGKPRRIEPQVSVAFLAVHASRNRVSQADFSEIEANTWIPRSATTSPRNANGRCKSGEVPEELRRQI